MRAAAEIDELRARACIRVKISPAFSVDQLAFHPGFGVFLQSFFFLGVGRVRRGAARAWISHIFFSIFSRSSGVNGVGAVEIVVEAVLDGRADAELRLGIEFQHRGGQQVRGGVAVDFERLGILGGQDLQRGVLFDGAGEIEHLAVDLGRDRRVRQAGTDAFGDIDGTGLRRDRLFTAVGQSNFDVTHREISA